MSLKTKFYFNKIKSLYRKKSIYQSYNLHNHLYLIGNIHNIKYILYALY